MPPEKIVSWKKSIIERMPTANFCILVIALMKKNPQHQEQNLFQPQTAYHFRNI